jgi:CDP-diglyceride synthetase
MILIINKRKLLIRLTSLVFFIFVINTLANKFYWYSSIWYFDMPMHFLGGFWLALVLIYLFPLSDSSFKSIYKIILGVLFIGVLWELFELFFKNYVAQNPFNGLDALSDIFFDLAGGFTGVFYFFKRIMFKEESKVQ